MDSQWRRHTPSNGPNLEHLDTLGGITIEDDVDDAYMVLAYRGCVYGIVWCLDPPVRKPMGAYMYASTVVYPPLEQLHLVQSKSSTDQTAIIIVALLQSSKSSRPEENDCGQFVVAIAAALHEGVSWRALLQMILDCLPIKTTTQFIIYI